MSEIRISFKKVEEKIIEGGTSAAKRADIAFNVINSFQGIEKRVFLAAITDTSRTVKVCFSRTGTSLTGIRTLSGSREAYLTIYMASFIDQASQKRPVPVPNYGALDPPPTKIVL